MASRHVHAHWHTQQYTYRHARIHTQCTDLFMSSVVQRLASSLLTGLKCCWCLLLPSPDKHKQTHTCTHTHACAASQGSTLKLIRPAAIFLQMSIHPWCTQLHRPLAFWHTWVCAALPLLGRCIDFHRSPTPAPTPQPWIEWGNYKRSRLWSPWGMLFLTSVVIQKKKKFYRSLLGDHHTHKYARSTAHTCIHMKTRHGFKFGMLW